jgi:concentrative nucleoside transporter, CNT family
MARTRFGPHHAAPTGTVDARTGAGMSRAVSALGLLCLIGIAWALSERRRAVNVRLVLWGVGLQYLLGALFLLTPLQRPVFAAAQSGVEVLTAATLAGAGVVFGRLASFADSGSILAFQALPVIILVSALSAVLYHYRVIQAAVHAVAWVMRRTMGTSGAETFSAAIQILLGIEAMAALRGYVSTMTRSELCAVMITFMASIAGSVMVIYARFGVEPGHLLIASLMSAPAALCIAKLLVPETREPQTSGAVRVRLPVDSRNVFDALSRGTADGLQMALNVGAMLIAFIAVVFLLNHACEAVCGRSFTLLAGYAFRPFAWLMGVPSPDVAAVGELLGTKTILNEFLAYQQLQPLIAAGALSPRAVTIATYALCGFANPGSLGILLAAMTNLAPERRDDIVTLGAYAFLGGVLCSFMTACVAGTLIGA